MTQVAPPPQIETTPSLRLTACVLLAGSLRASPLAAAARCSVLDLYLTPSETVLDVWMRHFEAIAAALDQKPVVHVIYGAATPAPRVPKHSNRLEFKLQEDAQQFRGPAGAVRDACSCYPPDATVLVVEAARYVSGDLTRMVAEHQSKNADITVACNEDSTPAGLFLIRCATLELVPTKGFTDLKEQWLKKALDKSHSVRVHRLRDGYSYELRTREGFLHAAAAAGGLTSTSVRSSTDSAVVPADSPDVVHAVRDDVSIGNRAVIVDSVVMPGASIGEDAVVARSILCPGARVNAGGTVVEGVVPAGQTPGRESVG
ncbi:MAG TPA: hypothetical protein VD997_04425 [Phycisphaerales bacterium]|nr:hypothetical protein [Phycisphaerales bacterium]